MGNNLQKYKNQYKFLNWNIPHPDTSQLKQLLPQYSNCPLHYIVLQNNKEQFRVYHQEFQNIQHSMQLYQWRSMTNKPVIKVHFVDVENNQEYQLNSQNLRGYVFTEHLVMTLENIKNIGSEDAVYLLKSALIGYSSIFRVLGHTVVKENLIGVTRNGQCKVWNNNCLNLNTPLSAPITTQEETVYEIIKIVRNSTSPTFQCFYISLLKHLDISQRVTFKECLQFIQNYQKKNQVNKSFSFMTQPIDNTLSRVSVKKIQEPKNIAKKGNFMKLGKLQSNISNLRDTTITFSNDIISNKMTTDRSIQLNCKSASRTDLKKSSSPPSFLNMKKWVNNHRRISKKTSFHLDIVSKQGQFQSIKQILGSDYNIQFRSSNQLNKRKVASSKGFLTSIKQNKEEIQNQCPNTNHFPFKKIIKPIKIAHQFSISISNQIFGNRLCSQVMKQSLTSTKKSNIQSVRSQSKCSKPRNNRKYRCPYNSQFLDQSNMKKSDLHAKRHSCQRLMYSPFNVSKRSYDKYSPSFPFKQDTDTICISPTSESYGNRILFKSEQLSNQDYRPSPTTRRFQIAQQQQQVKQKIKQKQQQILKNNSWKKTIQCLLNDTERQHNITLNQSISIGGEQGFLSQNNPKIALQMLSNFGREIKNSVCPS